MSAGGIDITRAVTIMKAANRPCVRTGKDVVPMNNDVI